MPITNIMPVEISDLLKIWFYLLAMLLGAKMAFMPPERFSECFSGAIRCDLHPIIVFG